jgi:hypothetical protein
MHAEGEISEMVKDKDLALIICSINRDERNARHVTVMDGCRSMKQITQPPLAIYQHEMVY